MSKVFLRCSGLALMAVLVAFAMSSAPAVEAGVRCNCLTSLRTAYASGMAESCPDALADLHARLDEIVLCPADGFCYDEGVVVTSGCYYNGMGGAWWKYDGYRKYRCSVCIDVPDNP